MFGLKATVLHFLRRIVGTSQLQADLARLATNIHDLQAKSNRELELAAELAIQLKLRYEELSRSIQSLSLARSDLDARFVRGKVKAMPALSSPSALGQIETSETEASIAAIRRAFKGPKIPASAFVINFNEGAVAELSVLSLLEFDQIVFVDKGSTDGSIDTIRGYGVEWFSEPWTAVVEHTRADADARCRHEWRLFLDADEFLTPGAVAILRRLVELDGLGKLPFDVIRIPRFNYLGGVLAKANVYAPGALARMYRRGFYNHQAPTHEVDVSERARVLDLSVEWGDGIIHFNQNNAWEYIEKLNRYTETYRTDYPPPKSADEVIAFARMQINRAADSVKARNGAAIDAMWEILTAFYYVSEYIKQHENNDAARVDQRYAETISEILGKECAVPPNFDAFMHESTAPAAKSE